MGWGPFSSDSKSAQSTVNVGGSGQYNKNSRVAQGGSIQLDKGANAGGFNNQNNKGTITVNNTGVAAADLKSVFGDLLAATPAGIQQASPPPPTPTPAASPPTATSTSTYLKIGLGIAAAVAVGVLLRTLFKK